MDPEINLYRYRTLMTMGSATYIRGQTASLTNDARKTRFPYIEKGNWILISDPVFFKKVNSICLKIS